MLKKIGVIALLATALGGCYCGPGYGYGPRYSYVRPAGYGWHHYGWRRW